MLNKVRFIAKDRDSIEGKFFATVKQRVDSYFKENNISRHANLEMVLKTVFSLGSFVSLYALLMLNTSMNIWLMLMVAISFGILKAYIGFNICHDAIHGGYSSNKKVNKVLGLWFNIIGANAYVWSITHNVVHHT